MSEHTKTLDELTDELLYSVKQWHSAKYSDSKVFWRKLALEIKHEIAILYPNSDVLNDKLVQ